MAAEATKALYLVVLNEGDDYGENSFRYTRPVLQSTLQLMGCKARHAFKISRRVFELMGSCNSSPENGKEPVFAKGSGTCCVGKTNSLVADDDDDSDSNKTKPFEMYKRRTTVVVSRQVFLDVVCDVLAEYKYVGRHQRADLVLACRIRERKESVTILLCGTSGCGKSTLSALLGSRLGITTVVSTDSIRHMMRSFADEKENPLLWASTYHAGEYLDPVAVAESKAKRKAKKLKCFRDIKSNTLNRDAGLNAGSMSGTTGLLSHKQMAIEGYKAQSEMVIDSLDRLITTWEDRKESVIVEGVHLSLNFVMGLMKKHPSIIPFMVYIANEEKHLERFAVRAKYMTLDPAKNKYVKYIRNIRTIQDYLCKRAEKHLVPKINNTNVDKSVATIHATVFSCLRRRETGEKLYDTTKNTVAVIDVEHRNQCAANSLTSKGMFQLIQRKGSSRRLMLLNTDGTVAKTWPVSSVDGIQEPVVCYQGDDGIEHTIDEYLQKAEPVNLQFGHFGISAWPSDGATSHAGSIDESRADFIETGSRHYSSCCSSPRIFDGPSKELKEDQSVNGSDEDEDEVDDNFPEPDSDEDLSDNNDEREVGSVDDGSTKSDDEYDDLAMEDKSYWTEKEEAESQDTFPMDSENKVNKDDKYLQNLNLFLRTASQPLTESLDLTSDEYKNRIVVAASDQAKTRQRSLSIPAVGKSGSIIEDQILAP